MQFSLLISQPEPSVVSEPLLIFSAAREGRAIPGSGLIPRSAGNDPFDDVHGYKPTVARSPAVSYVTARSDRDFGLAPSCRAESAYPRSLECG